MRILLDNKVRTGVVLAHVLAALALLTSGLWEQRRSPVRAGEQTIAVGLVNRPTPDDTGPQTRALTEPRPPDEAGADSGQTNEPTTTHKQAGPPSSRRSEWKARSAEAIRKSGLQSTSTDSPRPDHSQRVAALRRELNKQLTVSPRSDERTAHRPSSGTQAAQQYFSRLNRYLYRHWHQPALTGSAPPSVRVTFTVAADGTILKTTVNSRSGNRAVDKSVIRLVRKLNSVPAFEQFDLDKSQLRVTVHFKVDT